MFDDVRGQYADVVRGKLSNDSTSVRSIASAFGYTEDELNQLPPEANMGLFTNLPKSRENTMKTVQVYDKPMCCSTGVCGPEVDPVLPQFAADLDWLKSQGHNVERFNLAQQPQAFIDNKSIHQVLSTEGTDSLPVVIVNGEIVSRKVYPNRDMLIALVHGVAAKQLLPVANTSGGCCGNSGCC